MLSRLITVLFALCTVALLSGSAFALIANDPVAFCDQTGGTWTDCGSGCGPATCDTPDPAAGGVCPSVCTEMCECPAEAPLWAEGMGCISDKECAGGEDPVPPGMAMCEADGGTWDWCGSGCGPYTCDNPPPSEDDEPVSCPAVCIEQCACPGETPLWDDAEGCIAASECGGGESPQVTLCTETGGTWEECGSGCGPMGCGDDPADFEACPAVCLEQCGCPESAPLWHETMGCIAESDCEGLSEDADQDGYPASEECDDDNAGVYPGAVEVCNGIDDNCDGAIDEGCENTPSDEEVLCVTTGGEMADCLSGCAPFSCDNLPEADVACDSVCVAGCACPEDAPLWDDESGCYAVSECGDAPSNPEVLCESTGGQMGSIDDCAPFTCDNLPGEAQDCLAEAKYGCQCPDSAPLWSDEAGCFAATECEGDATSDPTALCEATGGEMNDCLSGCAPYSCDNPPQEVENCLAVCVMGCACPADAPLWSDEDGCFAESTCDGSSDGSGDGSSDGSGDGAGEPTVPEDDDADSGGCQGGAQGSWMLILAMMVVGWTTRRRMNLEA